jgi:hypothetical protein
MNMIARLIRVSTPVTDEGVMVRGYFRVMASGRPQNFYRGIAWLPCSSLTLVIHNGNPGAYFAALPYT